MDTLPSGLSHPLPLLSINILAQFTQNFSAKHRFLKSLGSCTENNNRGKEGMKRQLVHLSTYYGPLHLSSLIQRNPVRYRLETTSRTTSPSSLASREDHVPCAANREWAEEIGSGHKTSHTIFHALCHVHMEGNKRDQDGGAL